MPEPTIIFEATSAALAAFVVLAALGARRGGRQAVLAAAKERRRLARELHDGLAQELAFISMQARRVAQKGADVTLDQIADAADRALSESRELISTLRWSDEPLGEAITRTAEALAVRHGAMLQLEVDPDFSAGPEIGAHLVRIIGEAVSNSLVHGRAGSVTVQLSGGNEPRLCVTDDGIGFDSDANRAGDHFGITSMRERAREIGGEVLLRSRPGAGTEVEVVLP